MEPEQSPRDTWQPSTETAWVSTREAAEILKPAGVDRETARRVLAAGLAGDGIRLRGSTLYQRGLVLELRDRRVVPAWSSAGWEVTEACRLGTFVARVPSRRPLDPDARLAAAAGPWRISALGRLRLRVRIQEHGSVPLVATVGGFVVLGAEIVDVRPAGVLARGHEATMLRLRNAGDWFARWEGCRLTRGSGPAWWIWPDGLWSRPDGFGAVAGAD